MDTTPPVSHVAASTRKDSTSTNHPSPLISPSSSFFETFFHGNCKRCKHHHVSFPIQIPKNPRKHKRIHCEVCQYDIYGFGRNSTQTTLVSEQSLDFNRRNSRGSIASAANNTIPCTNNARSSIVPHIGNLAVGPEDPVALSPIAENASAIGRSRSNSHQRAQDSRNDISNGPHPTPPLHPSHVKAPPGISTTTYARQRERKRHHLGAVFSKVTKILKGSTEAKKQDRKFRWRSLLKWRNKRPSQDPALEDNTILPDTHQVAQSARESALIDEAFVIGESNLANDSMPGPSRQPNTAMRTSAESPTEKRERIKNKRRDITLKKISKRNITCICDDDCHCVCNGPGSDSTGGLPRSVSDVNVPPHHLQSLMEPFGSSSGSSGNSNLRFQTPTILAGVGEGFLRTQSPDNSSTTAVSLQGMSDRRSLSTTVAGSNGSTLALHTRPPLNRSESSPMPPRGGRGFYSQGLRGSSHNRSNLRHSFDIDGFRANLHTSNASTNNDSSSPSQIDGTDSSSQGYDINGSTRQNSDDSNVPNGEHQSNDVDVASSHGTGGAVNNDSEERTPRPRSETMQMDADIQHSPPDFQHVVDALRDPSPDNVDSRGSDAGQS